MRSAPAACTVALLLLTASGSAQAAAKGPSPAVRERVRELRAEVHTGFETGRSAVRLTADTAVDREALKLLATALGPKHYVQVEASGVHVDMTGAVGDEIEGSVTHLWTANRGLVEYDPFVRVNHKHGPDVFHPMFVRIPTEGLRALTVHNPN